MARDRPERLAQLASAGWFRDGLTTAEAAIVAVLYERSRFLSPEFDEIVANPGTLNVELGTATNRSGSNCTNRDIALGTHAGRFTGDGRGSSGSASFRGECSMPISRARPS